MRDTNDREKAPDLPLSELHDALGKDHDAHAVIDALHGELAKEKPSAREISNHVERLGRLPQLTAIVRRWWDDPRTQLFIQELTAAGL